MTPKMYLLLILAIIILLPLAVSYIQFAISGQEQTAERQLTLESAKDNEKELKQRAKELNKASRYALIIGVDEYKDQKIPSLSGAVNDAKMLAKSLINNAGFDPKDIVILTSDVPSENLKPTSKNIQRELDKLSSLKSKDAFVVVAFAGHGMEYEGNAYLIPSDVIVKPNENDKKERLALDAWSIFNVLLIKSSLQKKVKQLLVVMDACRSELNVSLDLPPPVSATPDPMYQKLNKDVESYAVLYATASKEAALEDKTNKQGYLTIAILNALSGKASDNNGRVTLSGLVAYVQDAVPQLTGGRQRPFTHIEGFKADRLVVAIPLRKKTR